MSNRILLKDSIKLKIRQDLIRAVRNTLKGWKRLTTSDFPKDSLSRICTNEYLAETEKHLTKVIKAWNPKRTTEDTPFPKGRCHCGLCK
jgi:hypothetical protein